MSLSKRLTLLLVGLLGVFAAVAAVAFYGSIRRSLEIELVERLDTRLDWLEHVIEVESDIRLPGGEEPAGAAEYWEVRMTPDRILWGSLHPPADAPLVERSRSVTFDYRSEDRQYLELDRVPRSVLVAIRQHLPGFVASRAETRAGTREPGFRIEGRFDETAYEIDVELRPSGSVREIDARVVEEAAYGGEHRASASGRTPDTDEELGVDPDDLPAAVRATIDRVVRGLDIDDVERIAYGAQVVYRIDAEAAETTVDLDIALDGTLLQKEIDIDEVDEEIALAEVPEPVRAAVVRELGDAEADIRTRLRGDRLVYEVEADVHGREVELNLFEDGTVRHKHVEIDVADLPAAVAASARAALGDLPVDDVRRFTSGGTVVYRLEAEPDGREVALHFAADGSPVERDPRDVFPRYRLPEGQGGLELTLTASTSSSEMEAELARLTRALLLAGPLALLACGLVLALLIRWQLRPLERMARQASAIGPANLSERIGPVGTSEECVKLRESINSMIERLAEGFERERRFSASAAHELRTPIAQLRAATEVALRSERDASEYRDVLVANLEDIGRLQQLVTGLLELARRRDATATGSRPVSLRAIVARARKAHGGVPSAEAIVAPDVHVEGDEDLFSAALSNVLENAARYAPGEAPAIALRAEGDHVELVVADRGPGVRAADRERIFEPLARLDRADASGGGSRGFGLGLAVARSTLRAFGGDLLCRGRSDGERGAEFVFRFRRARARSEAPPSGP